ncbi:MAG: PAS domain S-box protein [Kordiimonadaceae bacterium]|nr:PAS domain S-box protein [Kordiimonadaceae bacterium]
MSMIKYRQKRLKAFIVLVALLIGLYTSFGLYTLYISTEHNDLQLNASQRSELVLQKGKILENLHRSIGFGGFIHNFKNYVIRHNDDFYQAVKSDFTSFNSQIIDYKSLPLSQEENLALTAITNTINEYSTKLEVARKMIADGSSIGEIDRAVKVSDDQMIAALSVLESSWKSLIADQQIQLNDILTSTDSNTNSVRVFILLTAFAMISLFLYIIKLDNHSHKLFHELETSEAKFREMINSSGDAIITISSKGAIETFNKKAQNLFGYNPEEIISKNVNILMPPEERVKHDYYLNNAKIFAPKVIAQPRGLFGYHKNGSNFPIELNIAPYNAQGSKKYIGIIRDITERKILEASLLEEKRNAERASSIKSRFLANVSHELRTPLNAILGFSEMISKETLGVITPSKYVDYGNDIHSAGEKLREIINDVLDLARFETSSIELNMKGQDVREIINSAIKQVATDAENKQISLVTHMPEKSICFKCDQIRMKQVLVNIIGNAVKFTPENGTINVSCVRLQTGEIIVSIKDTGIGISSEMLTAISEPFVQHKHDRYDQDHGTGLGLAVSKHLIELHGGNLQINSIENIGSEFKLVFPSIN